MSHHDTVCVVSGGDQAGVSVSRKTFKLNFVNGKGTTVQFNCWRSERGYPKVRSDFEGGGQKKKKTFTCASHSDLEAGTGKVLVFILT